MAVDLEYGAGAVPLQLRVAGLEVSHEVLDHTLSTNRQTIRRLHAHSHTVTPAARSHVIKKRKRSRYSITDRIGSRS